MTTDYPSFDSAISATIENLLDEGQLVDSGTWQGVPTEGKPDLQTFELVDVAWRVPMPNRPGYELIALRDQISPNLPWADLQFAERVSRNPQNPDPSYSQWPWHGPGSDRALTHTEPDIDERDWAGLAWFIDGEGCITHTGGRSRHNVIIRITQKDKGFLHHIASKFHGVGRLNTLRERGEYRCEQWSIQRKAELRWVLSHIIPYLDLKRDKAVEALSLIEQRPPRHNDISMTPQPKFTHSYSERFWPPRGFGIRYPFGNLDDVVDLLLEHPHTRQAYMPIFGQEDIGARPGRIPCTLGYFFMVRRRLLHSWYEIRSCDAVRHLRDDIYMAARLQLWVLEELRRRDNHHWDTVELGNFTFHAYSFHAHRGDLHELNPELNAERYQRRYPE